VSTQPYSALQRWFAALKPGDKLRIRFPWDDRRVKGGAIVKAVVTGEQPVNGDYRRVSYRRRGKRVTEVLPLATAYRTLMPLDRTVTYSTRTHGLVLRKD